MKKLSFFLVSIVAIVLLSSCNEANNEPDKPKVDPREQICGTWLVSVSGSVDIELMGKDVPIPVIANDREIVFAKDLNFEDKFLVTGYYEGSATLIDGKVVLDETSSINEYQGMSLNYKYIHEGFALNDSVVSWKSSITCSATVAGVTITGDGSVDNKALKQLTAK